MKVDWPIKKLGEVAECQDGDWILSKDLATGNDVRLIQLGDIGEGKFLDKTSKYISRERCKELKCTLLEVGDILLARLGEPLGKACIFPNLPYPCITAVDVTIIRPKSSIDRDFLHLYLNSSAFREKVNSAATGATRKRISRKNLENLEIPVPGIEEQRRIVKKLEKILSKISESRTIRQESIEEAQNIIKTKLGELFENNSWDETRVSDIAEKPQYGYTVSSTKDKIGPRLLRITDIQNGMVDWENVPYCKCNEVDKYRLTFGDIVFARTGATTGKSFLIKDTLEQTVFASYLIRLKTKVGIKQEFLYWFFQSPQYWNQIIGHQTGSAQPNVNAVKLSSVKLRMPQNLKEQEKIVKYLDGLSEKVQALQKLQNEQLQELELLKQSVLHQAFQGRL